MNSDEFLLDLTRKPDVLSALADRLEAENPWAPALPAPVERVVFLGMGSSAYAGAVAAARLRARGVLAVSELASSDLLPNWGPGTLVIATSASGGSVETLDALTRLPEGVMTVALTNRPNSTITKHCDTVVDLAADVETGGVACRSFQHTLALFLALEEHVCGPAEHSAAELARWSAEASQHLLSTEAEWRPDVADLLLGPGGTHLSAPARRISSARQGALMLREGPRLAAIGCETGDWSHVDVYLTKNTDYRLLVFGGSRWEDQMAEWTRPRGTTVVGVGADVPGATSTVRYAHDEIDDVRLLTEALVPELVAARAWMASPV